MAHAIHRFHSPCERARYTALLWLCALCLSAGCRSAPGIAPARPVGNVPDRIRASETQASAPASRPDSGRPQLRRLVSTRPAHTRRPVLHDGDPWRLWKYDLLDFCPDLWDDARRLAKLLQPIRCKINLIPFNPHAGCEFERPAEAAIKAFYDILFAKNYTVIVRRSKGQDISAACGQLRARSVGQGA